MTGQCSFLEDDHLLQEVNAIPATIGWPIGKILDIHGQHIRDHFGTQDIVVTLRYVNHYLWCDLEAQVTREIIVL